ncbi:unnamed protein product [Amaranthus hypochondriacus]
MKHLRWEHEACREQALLEAGNQAATPHETFSPEEYKQEPRASMLLPRREVDRQLEELSVAFSPVPTC